MTLRNLNQKGDTIVEVLIAMVILAFVLTGAYESSEYSLNNIRNAENRITAVDIASNQIESLKAWASSGPTVVPTGDFYMVGDAVTAVQNNTPATQGSFMYEFNTPTIQQSDLNYTFTVNVYWPDLNRGSNSYNCKASNLSGCDSVTIPYRTPI